MSYISYELLSNVYLIFGKYFKLSSRSYEKTVHRGKLLTMY